MGDLRVKKKKGSNNKKHGSVSVTTIKFLPKELQVKIFAKVATRSVFDHCMIKLCCKEFLHAAEDDYVYRHASMENFALVPLPWFKGNNKESSFLKRCRESGNWEILYREGIVQYFTSSMLELGIKNLKEAALEGHHDAKYVYCMLLMCGKDELGQRKQGFDLFCSLKASSTSLIRCRKRVKSFIQNMWVNNNPAFKDHKSSSFCCSGTCDSERLSRRRWSPFEDKEDGGSIGIACERCAADNELSLFRNIFRV